LAPGEKRLDARLHVGGQNFLAVNMPEARVIASPDLTLTARGRDLDLAGTVTIPRARLRPRDLAGAVAVSPDQQIVGAQAVEKEPRWRLTADVTTRLGDDVDFKGFGLSGRIRGAVRVQEKPAQLATAVGELEVSNGEYQAYGQKLQIERGRLLYNGGPLTNPGLDIRAGRKVQEISVGVNIRGTLHQPNLQLFSDPDMPQTQQLSYLVLGVPLNDTSSADRQILDSASNQLRLAGGTLVARQLGRRLGIEDVTVEEGTAPNQAELVLGKYLSPRLYVSYGIGLYQAAETLRIRYQLSKRWTLETESGINSSADFLYTIER
jgi:translocation and assembly module TamB